MVYLRSVNPAHPVTDLRGDPRPGRRRGVVGFRVVRGDGGEGLVRKEVGPTL